MSLYKKLLLRSVLLFSTIAPNLEAASGPPIEIPYADPRPAFTLKLPAYRTKKPSPPDGYSGTADLSSSSIGLISPSQTHSFRVPEISSLEDFPALLTTELASFGSSQPRVCVFFDWDDTLTQREKQFKSGDQFYNFKYLSSPEVARQLQPTIRQVIEEISGDEMSKRDLAQQALEQFTCARVGLTSLTYRHANPNLPQIFSQLKDRSAMVKVCSGLGLEIDSERRKPLELLGLGDRDYICARDKAQAMVNCIFQFSQDGADLSQEPVPEHYFAVLIDNYMPDGADFFYSRFAQEVSKLQKTHSYIQITPLLVKDNRFENEVAVQLLQIKREIGYTLQLYKPLVIQQRQDAEKRLFDLLLKEGDLTLLEAALES